MNKQITYKQLAELLGEQDIIIAYWDSEHNNWHQQILILSVSLDAITMDNAPFGETYSIESADFISAQILSDGVAITFYDRLASSDASRIPITLNLNLLIFGMLKPKKIRKLINANA